MTETNTTQLLNGIKKADRRSLAKAITLIESTNEAHQTQAQELMEKVLPLTGKSLRIGISGIPGVGKSTFIENFGLYLLGKGHKLAVLAVDPSSPLHGGSLLGDKTRMELLSREEEAFIRPSPSSGHLGGVAHKTRETLLLCEAYGHDIILVETVGVGQSEIDVASLVDIFIVLMAPNTGDELQGIKKGILEIADFVVVNKADGDYEKEAQIARKNYENALTLVTRTSFWKTKVLTCSSIKRIGLDKLYEGIQEYKTQGEQGGHILAKRQGQQLGWFRSLFDQLLKRHISKNQDIQSKWLKLEKDVKDNKISPLKASAQVLELLFPKK
jgi:LAO/AO transport system kinase